MKRDGRFTCDKCQEAITDADEKSGSTLHYGRTDYHISCYLTRLREKGIQFGRGVVLNGEVIPEA